MKMLTISNEIKPSHRPKDVSKLILPDFYGKDTLIKIREAIEAEPVIHQHTLAKLSRIHNLHPKTLGRKFNLLFGITISDYIREKCMNKAYALVTTSTLSLGDIAFELGYSEVTNFIRAFKSYFGISPHLLRSSPQK